MNSARAPDTCRRVRDRECAKIPEGFDDPGAIFGATRGVFFWVGSFLRGLHIIHKRVKKRASRSKKVFGELWKLGGRPAWRTQMAGLGNLVLAISVTVPVPYV